MYFRILFASLFLLATAVPIFRNPAPFNFIGKYHTSELSTSTAKRNVGGVRLSDGVNFTGRVWYGIYPLNDCIVLNDYAGKVLSFRPDEDTNCLLMQNRCDSREEYADLYYNSTQVGDLSIYPWIKEVASYFCMEPI